MLQQTSFHWGKPPQQANLKPTFSGMHGEKLAIDLHILYIYLHNFVLVY